MFLDDNSRGFFKSFTRSSRSSSGTSLDGKIKQIWPTAASAYKLGDRCGRGGCGEVCRATCLNNGEEVAVKVVDMEALATNEQLETLKREAYAMTAYQHPHVLPLHCAFVHQHQLWMVMPYMGGGSVAHMLRYAHRDGLPEVLVASIMQPVAEALEYIHRQGGIHRDVKAGNILLGSDGSIRLGDFGSAAQLENAAGWGGQRGARLTLVGTPCWMAPEVLQGEPYDSSADIWSFGITLLELAHGHAPFAKYPPMKVIVATIQQPPPSLAPDHAGRHFSRAMRQLVGACLAKDPRCRPSAGQLLQQFRKFFQQARGKEYIRQKLLQDVPALPERVERLFGGQHQPAAPAGEALLQEVEKAKSHYLQELEQWDFSCVQRAMEQQDADAGASSGASSRSATPVPDVGKANGGGVAQKDSAADTDSLPDQQSQRRDC